MIKLRNHDDLEHDWNEISRRVNEASKQVADLRIDLLKMTLECETESAERKALNRLIVATDRANDELSGYSYMCHPQSEWLGGKDYVVRVPYIVKHFQ